MEKNLCCYKIGQNQSKRGGNRNDRDKSNEFVWAYGRNDGGMKGALRNMVLAVNSKTMESYQLALYGEEEHVQETEKEEEVEDEEEEKKMKKPTGS